MLISSSPAPLLCTACAPASASHVVAPPRLPRSHARLGIANSRLALSFGPVSGALTSIRNVRSGDEYLKHPSTEGNPFRFYVDPTRLPDAASSDAWSGKVEGDLGGRILDAASCRLLGSSVRRAAATNMLELQYEDPTDRLHVTLTIRLADGDDAATCTLSVSNGDARPHRLLTAFPHLTGLQLGTRGSTNRGLMLASFGTPDMPAWVDSGGFYGREVSMQWQDVYATERNEGFGFIVMDPALEPKLIRRFAPGGMSALYVRALTLPPGGTHTYPPVQVLVHQGNWRVAARRYGQWFAQAFRLRRPPAWLSDVDLFSGAWIPDAATVADAQRHGAPGSFTSFAQMPQLYLNDPYDLKEWAQYNDGVRTDPKSYGAYMADGAYAFRQDLGGPDAMRRGVQALHKVGRRVMFYVAGVSILTDSSVLAGTHVEDWLLMDRPGHGYDFGYPNGMSVCPGYGPWQNHLASVAKRILQETGADGIRLDELATFVPCYNPAHHHSSPFGANQWLRELVRKVRAAMDEVNTHALLLTESPIDYLHESCDGALQMFSPGSDIDPMRLAIPTYRGLAYHPGAVESALNGWIGGKTTARRIEWPWAHRGVPGRPRDYQPGPGPELRWHELRASFPEAVVYGQCSLEDPHAVNDSSWVGRLWQGRRYWMLVGGRLDGSPLPRPVRVRTPELPADVQQALEFDAQTLTLRDAHLVRSSSGACITVSSPLAVVLLPRTACPPVVQLSSLPAELSAGTEATLSVHLIRPWNAAAKQTQVKCACPGLVVSPARVTGNGTFAIRVPAGSAPGLYPLKIFGDCLPLKRWIKVTPAAL